ncbi:MAG TPA: CIA30 family protein [Phycisphaerae bacterium]|nr:CIA30 family protein [Phycisphaerae bacterium]
MLYAALFLVAPMAVNPGAGEEGSRPVTGQAFSESRIVGDFQDAAASEDWFAVNDTVMGGFSQGTFRITDDGMLMFYGSVSLDNNGGFASIRSRGPALDLSAYDSLVVRLRGDGREYSCSVRTDYPIMAGAYYFDVPTRAGQWQEIHLPLRSFQARSFGRPLTAAPPLNARDIRGIGFIIADKQEGPFKLEIDWVKAVRALDPPGAGDGNEETDLHATAGSLIEAAIARGTPLFNAGQPEACAAIYELIARSLVDLCAHELPPTAVAALRDGLREARQEDDPVKRAWILRGALDAAWNRLRQTDLVPRAESSTLSARGTGLSAV